MSIKNIIKILFLSILCKSCVFDRDDHKLLLKNNTKKYYYFILKKDSVLNLKDVNYIEKAKKFHIIKPNDSIFPLFARVNEGGYIWKINNECKDSTLFLYLFDFETIKNNEWEKIIVNKRYCRQGYKVFDLNKLNWVVYINQ